MANKDKERIAMKIIDEGKQLSIRIPKEFSDKVEIDPKKDGFIFELDKEDLHLTAELVDLKWIKKESKQKK
jgi:hypothetical protein